MINEFDVDVLGAGSPGATSTPPGWYMPQPKNHKRPKGKKALKKAVKKAEKERDQLLLANGQLDMENKILKRAIRLATSAKRRDLDDGLCDGTLRLLPPERE